MSQCNREMIDLLPTPLFEILRGWNDIIEGTNEKPIPLESISLLIQNIVISDYVECALQPYDNSMSSVMLKDIEKAFSHTIPKSQ